MVSMLNTEAPEKASTWLGEISSRTCLIFLPGPAWFLRRNKSCRPFLGSLSLLHGLVDWYINDISANQMLYYLHCISNIKFGLKEMEPFISTPNSFILYRHCPCFSLLKSSLNFMPLMHLYSMTWSKSMRLPDGKI